MSVRAKTKPERVERYAINGFPVSICTTISAARLKSLLGTHAVKRLENPRGQVVALVRIVDDMNVYEAGEALFSPDILLGDGFALDYATRTVLYPGAAPLTLRFKNLGEQNPFTRTIIFCVALLAQRFGFAEFIAADPRGLAPLYLHASAVLTRHGALVFCGECTFGKTTISTKLLRNFPLLEDDQVTVLTPAPGSQSSERPRVLVFGDFRFDPQQRKKNAFAALRDGCVPLAGIFWLKKDPHNAIETMEQTEAAAMLLNPMNDWQNPSALRHRLQLLRSMVEAIPVRRLAFKKESEPLEMFLREEGLA